MNKEISKEKEKKYKILRIIIQTVVLSIFVAGLIFFTIKLYPIYKRIGTDEEYKNMITAKIESYSWAASLIIISAQMVQTILAVIPAGPIVALSGMMFNPVYAIFLCVLGQTLGSVIVYFLVKLLGYRFAGLFFDPNKIKESKMLKNEEQTEVLLFGYLCIPALPKDITAFIAPFTKIKLIPFAIITFFARIPMTIVTVVMGASITSGNLPLVIILGSCSGLIALICFIFNKKIIAWLERIKIKFKIKKPDENVLAIEKNELNNKEIEEKKDEEQQSTNNNS